jgi:ABC-type polysaccharide/polyol phosphate export permease
MPLAQKWTQVSVMLIAMFTFSLGVSLFVGNGLTRFRNTP